MNTRGQKVVFWIVLLGVAALIALVVGNRPTPPRATYSQFIQQVQSGEVLKATINPDQQGVYPVDYSLKNGARLSTILPHDYRAALDAMQQKLVNIEIAEPLAWFRILANSTPFLILVAFWVFAMTQMSKHGGAK